MVDEALRALVARHRPAEVDATCASNDEHPLDEAALAVAVDCAD